MATAIPMTNAHTGGYTNAYEGVSWTTFFFGFFPALFRGHIAAGLLIFVAALFTFGLSNLVFMFTYNKWHFNYLMEKGFQPALRGTQPLTVNVAAGHPMHSQNGGQPQIPAAQTYPTSMQPGIMQQPHHGSSPQHQPPYQQ